MKAHHLLMVKRDENGELTEGREVPNNEWARMRRQGFDFATTEEKEQYAKFLAEQVAEKNARKDAQADTPSSDEDTRGEIVAGQGGWYEVKLGDLVEKVQGEGAAVELLAQMRKDNPPT